MMLARSGSLIQFVGRLRPEQDGHVGNSCANLSALSGVLGFPDSVHVARGLDGSLKVACRFRVAENAWLVHEFLGVGSAYRVSGALATTFFGALGFTGSRFAAVQMLALGGAITLPGPDSFDASCRDEDLEESPSWTSPRSTALTAAHRCSRHGRAPTTCCT